MMRKNETTSKEDKFSLSEKETEFNFGYFYRTIEEHINAYATQAGNPYSVTDIALRVGRLLEAKALRDEPMSSAGLVSQMKEIVPENSKRAGAKLLSHRLTKNTARRSLNSSLYWRQEEDAIIINAVKEQRQSAPELTRRIKIHLTKRTEGAIRQRIARLIAKGKLKQFSSEQAGVPHILVEAA